MELTEATANMQYVTSAVQHEWGAEYVVVTSDGLPIPDSSSTQGMLCTLSMYLHHYYYLYVGFKFWKVNSRKFHAVPEDDLLAPERTRRRRGPQQAESSTASYSASSSDCSCKKLEEDLKELVDEVSNSGRTAAAGHHNSTH